MSTVLMIVRPPGLPVTMNSWPSFAMIVGAMLAAGLTEGALGRTMGVLAVALAAVNVFGGFLVTRRMLEMFRKKDKKAPAKGDAQ